MGKQWKQWQTFFSSTPKSLQMVTAAMKLRHLLLGRKAMTNLDSILKSRDITLPTKVCPVKAMVFPVVMYGCESWIIKKAECWRIDTFEPWWWRRLLRVPWTAKRSNQSILKEISPGCSLEGLMLKLKLQYFAPWCEELTIEKHRDAGKGWRQNGMTQDEMVGWHHRLDGYKFEQALGVSDGQGSLVCCSPWSCKESDTIVTELNWLIWKEEALKSGEFAKWSVWVKYKEHVGSIVWTESRDMAGS